jgi:small subunit ribosomal protein S21|tara:strand:+ start:572 stop:778 length:207 start_codon:yes stop_codon:yes gene_type:complete
MKVHVQYDNWEKALRKFKKKILEQDKMQEVRDREFYEKPTTTRKKKAAAAKQRWRKHLNSQSMPKRMY